MTITETIAYRMRNQLQPEFWRQMAKHAEQQIARLEKHLAWNRGDDQDSQAVRDHLIQDLNAAKDMRDYYKRQADEHGDFLL